jgi:hypothetical protein
MSANLIVGKDPSGNKMPVAVDANGAVVISGTVSSIGNVEDILNSSLAVETVMAADVATIKSGSKTNDGSGNAITSTTVSSKRGLDVNIIAGGGGGGGGGTSAAYNATLPTYANGDPATLQTDVNGRLITTETRVAGYTIPPFDYKGFTYSGTNIATIVFKSGGSSGTTVATLTFGYTSGNLTSITKS